MIQKNYFTSISILFFVTLVGLNQFFLVNGKFSSSLIFITDIIKLIFIDSCSYSNRLIPNSYFQG